jgi:hypothetical protein
MKKKDPKNLKHGKDTVLVNEDDHELLYKEIQKRMKEDTKIEIHEVIV